LPGSGPEVLLVGPVDGPRRHLAVQEKLHLLAQFGHQVQTSREHMPPKVQEVTLYESIVEVVVGTVRDTSTDGTDDRVHEARVGRRECSVRVRQRVEAVACTTVVGIVAAEHEADGDGVDVPVYGSQGRCRCLGAVSGNPQAVVLDPVGRGIAVARDGGVVCPDEGVIGHRSRLGTLGQHVRILVARRLRLEVHRFALTRVPDAVLDLHPLRGLDTDERIHDVVGQVHGRIGVYVAVPVDGVLGRLVRLVHTTREEATEGVEGELNTARGLREADEVACGTGRHGPDDDGVGGRGTDHRSDVGDEAVGGVGEGRDDLTDDGRDRQEGVVVVVGTGGSWATGRSQADAADGDGAGRGGDEDLDGPRGVRGVGDESLPDFEEHEVGPLHVRGCPTMDRGGIQLDEVEPCEGGVRVDHIDGEAAHDGVLGLHVEGVRGEQRIPGSGELEVVGPVRGQWCRS